MAAFPSWFAWVYSWLNRSTKVDQALIDLAELQPDDRALDVGCGPGVAVAEAAKHIDAARISAVDPTATFVDMVRKRVPGAEVREAVAESLPFDDETFTVIWSLASLHHWEDRDAGLKEVAAKLAPGGRLLLMERRLKKPGHGITDLQTAEISTVLRGFGLTVDTVEVRAGRRAMRVVRAVKSGG